MTLVKNYANCAPRSRRAFHRGHLPGFFRNNWDSASTGEQGPAVNIAETGAGFRLELSAPGFKKENFHLTIEEGFLVIKGEKENVESQEEVRFTRREFMVENFERKFKLGETIDQDNINAVYDCGVLLIHLTKKEEEQAKPARDIKIS